MEHQDYMARALELAREAMAEGEVPVGCVIVRDGTVVGEDNFELLRKLRSVSDEPIGRFEFAYAVTCHKAQGSEFDFVIVFDESWVCGESRDRWLYTAITRAREKMLIIR